MAHASHGPGVCCVWLACSRHAPACGWHAPGMCPVGLSWGWRHLELGPGASRLGPICLGVLGKDSWGHWSCLSMLLLFLHKCIFSMAWAYRWPTEPVLHVLACCQVHHYNSGVSHGTRMWRWQHLWHHHSNLDASVRVGSASHHHHSDIRCDVIQPCQLCVMGAVRNLPFQLDDGLCNLCNCPCESGLLWKTLVLEKPAKAGWQIACKNRIKLFWCATPYFYGNATNSIGTWGFQSLITHSYGWHPCSVRT